MAYKKQSWHAGKDLSDKKIDRRITCCSSIQSLQLVLQYNHLRRTRSNLVVHGRLRSILVLIKSGRQQSAEIKFGCLLLLPNRSGRPWTAENNNNMRSEEALKSQTVENISDLHLEKSINIRLIQMEVT
jgi:hypothetical protein